MGKNKKKGGKGAEVDDQPNEEVKVDSSGDPT